MEAIAARFRERVVASSSSWLNFFWKCLPYSRREAEQQILILLSGDRGEEEARGNTRGRATTTGLARRFVRRHGFGPWGWALQNNFGIVCWLLCLTVA